MPRPYYILLLLALTFGCKKSLTPGTGSTGTTPGGSDTLADITAIGTPNGTAVTKTIGAAGGIIISDDGRAELNIPPGALPSDLMITIQPITNECPLGVGVAYDFLPEGTRFLTPATLTIHYTDDDIDGTDPYLLNLATQDSLNEWEDDIYKDVDTTGKTLVFDISHFSGKALHPMMTMKPKIILSALGGTNFIENQQGVFVVSQGVTKAQATGDPDPSLAFILPKPTQVSNNLVSNWTLSAGAQNGTISATSGSSTTYTAPNTILQPKTVRLSATVAINVVSLGRNKQKSRVSSASQILGTNLHLLPDDISFTIKVIFDIPDASGYNQAYHDEATFEVDVKNLIVTIPNSKIKNSAPVVTPATSVTATDSSVWIPESYGEINIVGGSGYIYLDSLNFNQRDILLEISSANTDQSSFDVFDLMSGVNDPIVGSGTGGYPTTIPFIYKDSLQVIDFAKGTALEGQETITITPIH
jgi:hypothetical protein